MNKYLKLIEAGTPYATRMSFLRNRIFSDATGTTDGNSNRIVRLFKEKPIYKRDEIVDYYPRHMEAFHLMTKLRKYGLFRDEHHEFVMEMKRARILKGKVKPKKGFGKQATNK